MASIQPPLASTWSFGTLLANTWVQLQNPSGYPWDPTTLYSVCDSSLQLSCVPVLPSRNSALSKGQGQTDICASRASLLVCWGFIPSSDMTFILPNVVISSAGSGGRSSYIHSQKIPSRISLRDSSFLCLFTNHHQTQWSLVPAKPQTTYSQSAFSWREEGWSGSYKNALWMSSYVHLSRGLSLRLIKNLTHMNFS